MEIEAETHEFELRALVGQTESHTDGSSREVGEALHEGHCAHSDRSLHFAAAATRPCATLLAAFATRLRELALRAHSQREFHGDAHAGHEHKRRMEEVICKAAKPSFKRIVSCKLKLLIFKYTIYFIN